MENWKLQTHREAKHYMSWHTPNYSIKANKVALKTLIGIYKLYTKRGKGRERERERERSASRKVQHVFPFCNKGIDHCFLAMAPSTWGGTYVHKEGAPRSHQTWTDQGIWCTRLGQQLSSSIWPSWISSTHSSLDHTPPFAIPLVPLICHPHLLDFLRFFAWIQKNKIKLEHSMKADPSTKFDLATVFILARTIWTVLKPLFSLWFLVSSFAFLASHLIFPLLLLPLLPASHPRMPDLIRFFAFASQSNSMKEKRKSRQQLPKT